jgi:hypothetical protein
MFYEEQPRGSFSITSVKKITNTYLVAQKQLKTRIDSRYRVDTLLSVLFSNVPGL